MSRLQKVKTFEICQDCFSSFSWNMSPWPLNMSLFYYSFLTLVTKSVIFETKLQLSSLSSTNSVHINVIKNPHDRRMLNQELVLILLTFIPA